MKFLGLLLVLSQSLFAAGKATEKLSCTAKELARFDCRLASGTYSIRLLPQTIAWNDGTWQTVDPMPLKGESVKWEKIEFKFLGGWPILQLWLWDKGFSETEVQSLHWFVADAEKRKFTVLSEGVVRKRRIERPPPPPEPKPGDKAPPPLLPVKYLYDPWEPASLKAAKNGTLEWQLGDQKKVISKTVEVKDGK